MGAWIEIYEFKGLDMSGIVAPLVGAWIEINFYCGSYVVVPVAPLVGAWIEIVMLLFEYLRKKSLPLWERGLKYNRTCYRYQTHSRSPCGSVD